MKATELQLSCSLHIFYRVSEIIRSMAYIFKTWLLENWVRNNQRELHVNSFKTNVLNVLSVSRHLFSCIVTCRPFLGNELPSAL
jgi:hypothetical protein